jgi:nicotinate-nucleotide adenylyltransferase
MTENAKDLTNFAQGKVLFDESFRVDLSSTELRHQLHQGVAKEQLISAVSPSVLQCIFSQNIYAGSKNKD